MTPRLTIAALSLGLLMMVVTGAGAAETTNLRIVPHWKDANHFWFERQTSDGTKEIVDVDANTGAMTVRPPKSEEQKRRQKGLQGGPVPWSGTSTENHTEIKFQNETQGPVTAYWVNSQGERTKYQTIPPNQTRPQHTFVGHAWEVTGEDGQFYGSIVAGDGGQLAIAKKVFPRIETPPKDHGGDANPEKQSGKGRRNRGRAEIDGKNWQARLDGGKLQIRKQDQPITPETGTNQQVPAGPKDNTPADEKKPKEDQVPVSFESQWEPVDAINALVGDEKRLVDLQISPDQNFLAMWLVLPIETQTVATIESSPDGGGRAVLNQRPYLLPGDPKDQLELVVCDTKSWAPVDLELPVFDFGKPRIRWNGDHRLLIEKIDRGHQRFRLFLIDPSDATVRTPIDETTDTFIWTAHGPQIPKVTYLDRTDAVIHSSETSGWRHLYWVDLDTDTPARAITKGEFLVRELIHVDETNETLDLALGEYHDDQDPYHKHLARVDFDGSNFVALTDGDGDHRWEFSPDRRFAVVSHSRVDQPPTHELRRTADGEKLATLAKARRLPGSDPDSPPHALPTVFSAKGRDAKTDIWGLISFPKDYDPASNQKYPVIEAIYAGPHGSHVPKHYYPSRLHRELNDLGFIVVQIDGMGTANRSKAFHDVCWQNLKDAGFPDRICWMKAAAKEFPAMDLDRVGIYGTSAGGQNAMGALLFHGDFYQSAMASCGCHDNRMDKASWNEQWMGFPVGPHYAESSNVDQAHRLNGNLFLIVGELDSNVPPESTLRVVDALIKANKDFDFLMIPGMGHSNGGSYGWQRTKDFFRQTLNPEP